MNKKEFMLKLAAYYKQPLKVEVPDWDNPGKMKMVPNPDLEITHKWLKSKELSDEKLEAFLTKVFLSYTPTGVNPAPRINFLETLLHGSAEVRAERAWESLKRLSSMDSYVFEDLRIQQVIESMSQDIHRFVNWKDNIEQGVWCKKEFIKLYIIECENPRKVERKVVIGYADKFNRGIGTRGMGVQYIGRPDKKKLIMATVKELTGIPETTGVDKMLADTAKKLKEEDREDGNDKAE